jgi:hypothetical protein
VEIECKHGQRKHSGTFQERPGGLRGCMTITLTRTRRSILSDVFKTERRRSHTCQSRNLNTEFNAQESEASQLDKANGNKLWQDAAKLEIKALTGLECFDFKDPEYKIGKEYQHTTLTMIFDCKHDLHHKCHIVAGGHLVDALDHNIYSSTVKGVSVTLLHVVAHKTGMTQLCGGIGNAYVNTREGIRGGWNGVWSSFKRFYYYYQEGCVPPDDKQ